MRFRLRYQHHDLALGDGQFVVGRSAGCQLSLDDPLVSRRHAMLVVARDVVTVEDLESRNGVLVNGERITGKTVVQPGDKILIGSQELLLLRGRDNAMRETASLPAEDDDAEDGGRRGRHAAEPHGARVDRAAGAAARRSSPASRRATRAPSGGSLRSSSWAAWRRRPLRWAGPTRRSGCWQARWATWSRRPAAESRSPPWLVDVAARLAAKLATATTKGAWADYVIEIYQAQGRPCAGPVVDELNSAFRKVNAIDVVRLRAYLAELREKQATFGPAERFLLQRIEGLERLAALR